MRLQSGGDGGCTCAGKGMDCHVIVEPADLAVRTANHDEALAELTTRYKELLAPYLKPREDGKVLRLADIPGHGTVFVWATCYGEDTDPDSIAANHGGLDDSPNALRAMVGLDPL
jgi:hypothetical protein